MPDIFCRRCPRIVAVVAMIACLTFGGVLLAADSTRAAAQNAGGKKRLPAYLKSVKTVISPARVAVGGKAMMTVTITVAPGFHINAHEPGDPNLIATVLTPRATTKAITVGKPTYPKPLTITAAFAEKPVLVYEDKAVVSVPVTVTKQSRPGKVTVTADLRLQGCNETSCFPPATLPVSASLIIKGTK